MVHPTKEMSFQMASSIDSLNLFSSGNLILLKKITKFESCNSVYHWGYVHLKILPDLSKKGEKY